MSEIILIKITILALFQGLTEFIPVSSSGILVVIEELIKLQDKNLNLLFNISVHFGSLIAVMIYFYKDVIGLLKNFKLLLNIIIATIPVVIIGGAVKLLNINTILQAIPVVATTTIFFSLVLYWSDKTKVSNSFKDYIKNKEALIIGLAQAIAIIPGTSRSGITITAARFLGFNRIDSAKFSFLICMPVLFAATVLGSFDIVFNFDKNIMILLFVAFLLSLISSIICIKYFLKFLSKYSLNFFVIVRLIIGFGLIFYIL